MRRVRRNLDTTSNQIEDIAFNSLPFFYQYSENGEEYIFLTRKKKKENEIDEMNKPWKKWNIKIFTSRAT